MERKTKIFIAKTAAILAVVPVVIFGRSAGPDPRNTGAPGDTTCGQSSCHNSTPNSTDGKVEVIFPKDKTYVPGEKQRLMVKVSDDAARIFGFQITARLASNEKDSQAGDFTAIDSTTWVQCDDGSEKTSKGCGSFPVQFVQHSLADDHNTFTFDWTPPDSDQGNVRIYVAGNGANGNGKEDSGDHIYLADYTLTPATASNGDPAIAANGVVNAASFKSGIQPASWVTIQGTNLATTTRDWTGAIQNGKCPTQLAGVSVKINGKNAFVSFVSPKQINVQAPSDANEGPVPVQVIRNGVTSKPGTAMLQKFSPAFFLWTGKYAVATGGAPTYLNPRSAANIIPGFTTTPAKPGEVIILWGTGFGDTNPSVPAGELVPASPIHVPKTLPVIRIGGVTAPVLGAALSPNFVGVYQITTQIPASAPDGDTRVVAEVGGFSSPDNVFLNIKK